MFENYHTIRKKKSFIEKSLLAKNGSNWEGGGGVTEYKKHEF